LSLLTLHAMRGKVAMDAAGVQPSLRGVAVHDGWSPYWCYPLTHALCGAHMCASWTRLPASRARAGRPAWPSCWPTSRPKPTGPRDAGAERVDDGLRERLWARYQRLLADRHAANPPPPAGRRRRGRVRRCPAANLLGRLDTHQVEVLRFLDDLRVPFDNNHAERDLRMVEQQQKISGCWRKLPGA
jgi:transposase